MRGQPGSPLSHLLEVYPPVAGDASRFEIYTGSIPACAGEPSAFPTTRTRETFYLNNLLAIEHRAFIRGVLASEDEAHICP